MRVQEFGIWLQRSGLFRVYDTDLNTMNYGLIYLPNLNF